MPHNARAVFFDLDDTLYSLDRFVLSGFVAVATDLERSRGLKRRAALTVLVDAFRRARGREFQYLVSRFSLPISLIPSMVERVRTHAPRLRLPMVSSSVLAELRQDWRIGIVTNGRPDIQARKVQALGLAGLVDTVVYAHEIGERVGKPDPAVFIEAAARLNVPMERAVFVGDDPAADVFGAARVGMQTIQVARDGESSVADAVVRSLKDVPRVAEQLIDRNRRLHVQ